MKKLLLLVVGLLLMGGGGQDSWSQPPKGSAPEPLAITQEQQQEVAVTIYNGNLGLVKDIREVVLPQGVSEVKFIDVAAQIDPTTVHLKSLTEPSSLRVLEQNYEYDLLNPQKLMDKYVGRKVKLLTSDGTAVEATLLSNNQRPIYEINGEIYMGITDGSSCRRSPRISSRSPRWCGSWRTGPSGPIGWRPHTSPGGSPGRRTTSWS